MRWNERGHKAGENTQCILSAFLVIPRPKGMERVSHDLQWKGHSWNLDVFQLSAFRVSLLALQARASSLHTVI